MTPDLGSDLVQFGCYVVVLLAIIKPLGWYMAKVYDGSLKIGTWQLATIERPIYRALGFDVDVQMNSRVYTTAVLTLSIVSVVLMTLVQLVQAYLPGNPQSLPGVPWDLAINTAISFVTNTDWQSYSGESSMSYLTQMLCMTVQNFVSPAVGMAVLVALIRGLRSAQSVTLGNFWIDLARGIFFILLPLSFVFALVLVSQGVVQTFRAYPVAQLVEPLRAADGTRITQQTIAVGPAASQIAIKQLGTNGGGFFGVNSAHPFENPTPLSNFLQMLAILAIPAALCYTFGELVGDRRQGWALLAVMLIIFLPLLGLTYWAESHGDWGMTDMPEQLGAAQAKPLTASPNMEGKETRFGIANSALWSVATTAASNGSVNAMHDSFTPLGGLFPMWLMQLGEVIFGGAGSGLYGLLAFAIIAVFIAGLMVGRTPEYLGKKIEAFEMKMAMTIVILPCAAVLLGTALALSTSAGRSAIFNAGPHGLSEVLYALSSTSNNNGSAFAGLATNSLFYNGLLSVTMLIGRFGVIIPVLAMAGSLARKKITPASSGTLPTNTPLFVLLLVFTVLLVGALSFFPALSLGPIVEHLSTWTHSLGD